MTEKDASATHAGTELATLGGGCFWCLEAVFDQLQGVTAVTSGYAGGHVDDPTYEAVCSGDTGHAEVVQVSFVPEVISYRELLAVFFATHDPTTLNRQGNDVGTQYRSVIYYHSPAQKLAAEETVARLNRSGTFAARIVTELAPAGVFYPAEDYHQRYYESHLGQPYCRLIIDPKVSKFRQQFAARLKT